MSHYRRSLYTTKSVKKGEAFTFDNVRSVRPSLGLNTRHYPNVIGRICQKDLDDATALQWDQVGSLPYTIISKSTDAEKFDKVFKGSSLSSDGKNYTYVACDEKNNILIAAGLFDNKNGYKELQYVKVADVEVQQAVEVLAGVSSAIKDAFSMYCYEGDEDAIRIARACGGVHFNDPKGVAPKQVCYRRFF